MGSSEHFTLPRVAPRLREVNAYLGWFGPASRAMVMSAGTSVAMKVPGVDKLWSAAGERFVQGSTGGPDEEARSKSGSHIVAIAYDAAGRPLSEVHVSGVDGYTFTGRMLAWGAERVAAGALKEPARSARWTRSASTSWSRAARRPASRSRARAGGAQRRPRGRPDRLNGALTAHLTRRPLAGGGSRPHRGRGAGPHCGCGRWRRGRR